MRILFADDSMTAQNMGKKILTEAGYEVVAVSNGAAAVKKIAEQKPDIIILDIYMPGYTGLEVCDKVRASVDTLKTPVLLTVGKMEPYRAEDANRVKADGVIIKPFEASDLLAVVKKLEERVTPRTVALAEQTVRLERLPDFEELTPQASQSHTQHPEMHVEAAQNTVPSIVDVPDNMATAAAFGDLLGPEPVHSLDPPLPAMHTPVAEPPIAPKQAPPVSFSTSEANVASSGVVEVPEFTAFASETVEEVVAPPVPAFAVELAEPPAHRAYTEEPPSTAPHREEVAREQPKATAVPEIVETAPPSFPDTQPIPIYHEQENEEFVVASDPATLEVVAEPEFSVPAAVEREEFKAVSAVKEQPQEVVPVEQPAAAKKEAALSVGPAEFGPFSAKVDARIQEIETIVSASEARQVESEITPPAENHPAASTVPQTAAPAEDDFEARVAAAMSIYDEDMEEGVATAPDLVDETAPAISEIEIMPEPALESEAAAPFEISPAGTNGFHAPADAPALSAEAPYSFEYSPPVRLPEPEIEPEPAAAAEIPEPVVEAAAHYVEMPLPAPAAVSIAEPEPEEIEIVAPVHDSAPPAAHEPVAIQEQSRVEDETIISEIEAQLPAATAASLAAPASASPEFDTQVIAAAVHRVLERLTPHLIEEISRELKNSK